MTRARALLLPSLAVAFAASCSVFPDEAVLLPPAGEAGAAGEASGGQAGAATLGGAPAAAGNDGLAGEPSLGGSPAGGAPDATGGVATGGAPSECPSPRAVIRDATADTWIEQGKPSMGHGADDVLSVVGGSEEHRALVQFTLPIKQSGNSLIRATVRLHLQSNADATRAERLLELSQLEQQVDADRATWTHWGNGNRQWQMAGGDFGLAVGSGSISAQQAEGWVSFDVTAAVDAALSTASAVPFPLILREVGPAPTSPGELAFTSTEGDDLEDPELLIEYCQ